MICFKPHLCEALEACMLQVGYKLEEKTVVGTINTGDCVVHVSVIVSPLITVVISMQRALALEIAFQHLGNLTALYIDAWISAALGEFGCHIVGAALSRSGSPAGHYLHSVDVGSLHHAVVNTGANYRLCFNGKHVILSCCRTRPEVDSSQHFADQFM